VFTNLFVGARTSPLIEDPRIAAVTLTGSERAGMSVAATAGTRLKKSVLELGGSDPFIVLPLGRPGCDRAHGGDGPGAEQRAVLHRRQAVHRGRAGGRRVPARFTEAMDALVVGDPFDPATNVGPIVSEAQRAELVGQVEDARSQGATVHSGGQVVDGPGWYLKPTVLSGVTPDMPVAQEELFGPVAMVERVPDLDAAIEVANSTSFGLGSSVWTTTRRTEQRRASRNRGRRRLRQRHGGLHARAALRRDQALGVRPRAVRARIEGVRQRQDRMDHMSAGTPHAPVTTYLDHAATTPLRPEVAEAMAEVHGPARWAIRPGATAGPTGAAPPRGIPRRGGSFLGRDPGEIVFTSGGTESANLAVFGTLAAAGGGTGAPSVLCSAVEHPAVLESCRAAATRNGSA
jgi:hypothetical protein